MRLDDAKKMIIKAYESERLAHAYLINGSTRGTAADLAIFIMRLLACETPEGSEPCGRCQRCQQVAERTWCNNLWIYPLRKSRVISIGQMRKTEGMAFDPPYLLNWLGETAFAGGWKVSALVGADRMNEAAANAFLKMLEEPPKQTVILLLTDSPQALLPTIRSRCQQIDLDEVAEELEDPWKSQVLEALSAETRPGPIAAMMTGDKLLQVLDKIRTSVEKIVMADLPEEDESGTRTDDEVLDALVSSRYRETRSLLILTLQRWYRDLLVLAAEAPADTVHYQEYTELLRKRARNLTMAQALTNVENIEGLGRQLDRSMSEKSVFHYWMDRMNNGVV